MSQQAFQKYFGGNIFAVKYAVEYFHDGKYKTADLINALKILFEEDVMFGDPEDYTHGRRPVKVGVTMTNGSMYSFYRARNKSSEMKTWEAARTTSAYPVHVADSESKLLWPHHHHLDIVLSVGTGYEPHSSDSNEDYEAKDEGYFNSLRRVLKHVLKHNSEKTWKGFLASPKGDEEILRQ
ncbi:hypothetical protein BDD12DRAFT_805831 [Trichophaea hybrida]|nr:hypothetical protein BDD12DRAFT_805831 [Trichophaea hybrida]